MFNLLDSIIRSLLIGSLYSLVALGVTLIFSISRIANFAHGEFTTIGGYLTVLFTFMWIKNILITLIFASAITGLVSVVCFVILFKPLLKRGSKTVHLMIVSIGLSLILKYTVYMMVSPNYLQIQPSISIHCYSIAGIKFTDVFMWTLPTAIFLMVILHLLLHKTKVGVAMRASSENPTLAYARGIDVMVIQSVVWFIGGMLAGIAGGFWSIYSQATPEMGSLVLLRAFAASCLGGFTSYYGTIAGGYIISSAECMLSEALYFYFNVDVAYKPLISYIVLVIVLLIKPTGLAGISFPKRLGLWKKEKLLQGKEISERR